jgi:hypothetical protein
MLGLENQEHESYCASRYGGLGTPLQDPTDKTRVHNDPPAVTCDTFYASTNW